MKIRLFAVAVMLVLAGCATSLPSSSTAKSPAVNLSGFPLEFRAGYSDGCASVNAARRRDEARFKTDVQYAQGWRDGYDICRRKKPD